MEKNKEKWMKRNEDSQRDFWDNINHTDVWIKVDLEEEEKERGSKKVFEDNIVRNFPNMGKKKSQSSQKSAEHPINSGEIC